MGYDKQENYVRAVLLEDKFKQCLQDECIFSLFDADTNTDIDVVLFVDGFLTSSENDHPRNQLLNILRGKYGDVSETTPSETHVGIKWETLLTGDIKISILQRIKSNNQFFKLRSMILNCNNSKHGNYTVSNSDNIEQEISYEDFSIIICFDSHFSVIFLFLEF